MNSLAIRQLYYGKDEPLPEPIPLRAGSLQLIYQAGDLRYIKLGEVEVIRRIYAAVRDRNWGTVPGLLRQVKIDADNSSFRVRDVSEHKQDEIDFTWAAEIRGDTNGRIRFRFRGVANSTFLKNRIGFCVLHPIERFAGEPARVWYVNGHQARIHLPEWVSPEQPVPGTQGMKAIAWSIAAPVSARLQLRGDAFEMEDQRNWIDASFKTYCTPVTLPFPVSISAGTKVTQEIVLSIRAPSKASIRKVTHLRPLPDPPLHLFRF